MRASIGEDSQTTFGRHGDGYVSGDGDGDGYVSGDGDGDGYGDGYGYGY